MKILDLFSGLGGFSRAFAERGHKVITVDINPKFNPTFCMDILDLEVSKVKKMDFDVILASPPCQAFSVASIGCHWTGGKNAYIPKTDIAKKSIEFVYYTKNLIEVVNPPISVIENPRGMLRKIIGKPIATITYCQYGDFRMKPTDLWGKLPLGGFPPLMQLKKCRNNSPCHEPAPRGAKTGTQGIKNIEKRAEIPYGFSYELCVASEKYLRGIHRGDKR